MSVEIKTNRAAWKTALEKAADKAADALTNQVINDSLDYIPDDGEHQLRDSGRVAEGDGPGEKYATWGAGDADGLVYAGYQWYGVRKDGTHQVKHYTTAGTGAMWAEKAKQAHGKEWDQVAQNGFTEGLR